MRRIRHLILTAALLASTGAGALAQTDQKGLRIGVFMTGSEASTREYMQGLRDGLAAQGLLEGKSVILDVRYANGQLERIDPIAAELVRSAPDLLFVGGDQGSSALKRATNKIPIVAVTCDALAAGLVSNLARPGENLTGVTCINSDLAAKRIELMKDAMPAVSRLGVMFNPGDRRMRSEFDEAERAAKAESLIIEPLYMAKPDDIEKAFVHAAESQLDGISVVFDAMTFFYRKRLADIAIHGRIATVFNFRQFVEAGGLMSFGPNLKDMYRQSARHVLKVSKGEPPGEIPMEQPTHFELVLNMKTAKAIGVQIPSTVIARANEIIE